MALSDPSIVVSGLPPSVGRYRVLERIGKGAMGVVYAAEDEAMGRRVAVKVMMADLEEEPETRERFLREARVTGQLVHRNIVTVFDLGEDRGRPFIVMELLNGLPLADYLATPPARSLGAKLDLMMQVCEGLGVAHRRGVIHRDVKPSNIYVQHDGGLKILDFGVARLPASNLTASGFLVGTPDYMSPEQAQGGRVDPRSDLFSAAGVFYFMLTGRAPFASPDLPKVLHAVVHEDPIPLDDREAPEPLRRLLAKGLAKSPVDRYPDCSAMRADLGRVVRLEAQERRRTAHAFEMERELEPAAVPAASRLASPPEEAFDRTLVRPPAAGPAGPSLRTRVAGFWHRMLAARGQSTTEWLMVAGILTAVAVFLVESVPRGLGTFMKALAMSVRTIAP